MNSLDPRVNRLPAVGVPGQAEPKAPMDQFGTFEVFVQPRDGKPFQHEGVVHAPNLELAFVLAKEAFTRRFLCVSIFVADTRHVHVSPMTEGNDSVLNYIRDVSLQRSTKETYEIFQLPKRGKQHLQAGQVEAAGPEEAMAEAKKILPADKVIYNLWVIRTNDIRYTRPEEKELWLTLPEKKFRDASDYKGGDKLKEFLERAHS
ncbi:MAG: phenylacetic acid degradation b [Cyclobacteriaceae bacterium]|jgi:ring-1,2-phenylacetyl-CoA epoxidase subunit PaaB|nr:phenylacetic acid degradation b [Cyclobacteriaceae bacterium]